MDEDNYHATSWAYFQQPSICLYFTTKKGGIGENTASPSRSLQDPCIYLGQWIDHQKILNILSYGG